MSCLPRFRTFIDQLFDRSDKPHHNDPVDTSQSRNARLAKTTSPDWEKDPADADDRRHSARMPYHAQMGSMVIIGVGGLGMAIAKRIGAARRLVLADFSQTALDNAAAKLQDDGHSVETHTVDIADPASVQSLAIYASQLGRVEAVIHTAGLSPSMAPPERIFEVDLLGTAVVIEMFQSVIAAGGSLICIASIAGHMLASELPAEVEAHLARASLERLLDHEFMNSSMEDSGYAYGLSKRANQIRVQAAARAYGKRGCRINSISPGVIRTTMLKNELDGNRSQTMQTLVEDSPARRFGTPSDIANVAAFLLSHEASFITGTDIVVDGGSTAAQAWGGFNASDSIHDLA